MMRGKQPTFIAVGGIIIDDIVYPDGSTRMGVLGGGATHAAAGMTIWDQRPGMVAHTGYDLPDNVRQRLERDFDTQGLIALDVPQARAWQIFEWDGRRTEIFRVDEPHSFTPDLEPDSVPAAYRAAHGVHILAEANRLAAWRAVFPQAVLFWEPEQPYMIAGNADEFRARLPQVDIVSPNWLEAQLVYGRRRAGRGAADGRSRVGGGSALAGAPAARRACAGGR
jgi:sugar/nucleoside kinase (ribokinase family)